MKRHEMQMLESLLSRSLEDTITCWEATRLLGHSASLVCEGNVCVPLLRSFDAVAERIKENAARGRRER